MVLQPDRRPAELDTLVYRKMSFVAQSLDRERTIATEMERQAETGLETGQCSEFHGPN